MRRAVLVLIAVLLVAGCGDGKKAVTTVETVQLPTTTTSGDPGKIAIGAFVAAARAGKLDAMWGMLSSESKQRVGPTLGEFKSGAGGELADSLAGFGDYKVIVSERLTPEFGIVGIDDGKQVFAVPLRLEGTDWRVELGSPVKIRPLGPLPGKTEDVVAQIGAAVEGPGGAADVVMYRDGATEQPQVRGTATDVTTFANFDPALPAGRHTVIVAATEGREAGATAWAFRVRPPG